MKYTYTTPDKLIEELIEIKTKELIDLKAYLEIVTSTPQKYEVKDKDGNIVREGSFTWPGSLKQEYVTYDSNGDPIDSGSLEV